GLCLFGSTTSLTIRSLEMARPLEQGDRIGVRLKPEARRMLETAAASLGVSKSQLVRAIVVQALRHESIARAALEDLDRPDYGLPRRRRRPCPTRPSLARAVGHCWPTFRQEPDGGRGRGLPRAVPEAQACSGREGGSSRSCRLG